jgi:hypothetical protein
LIVPCFTSGNPFSCRCGEGKAGRLTAEDTKLVQADMALKNAGNVHKQRRKSNVTSRVVNGYDANIK